MRVIATLLLATALGIDARAGGEGSCSAEEVQVANSCCHMCPVARQATTLGRLIVMEMPVALVDRGELEA